MFKELVSFWKNLFNFNGRTRRREYWVAILWNYAFICTYVLVYIGCVFLFCEVTGQNVLTTIVLVGMVFLLMIYDILFLIGFLSSSIRRCHDIGHSGLTVLWCYLGNLCCGIGTIVWIVFSLFNSKEDNKWGENPKSISNNQYHGVGSIILSIICAISSYALLFLVSMILSATGYIE